MAEALGLINSVVRVFDGNAFPDASVRASMALLTFSVKGALGGTRRENSEPDELDAANGTGIGEPVAGWSMTDTGGAGTFASDGDACLAA